MRKPDVVIGGSDNPYMLRWWLIPRNRWFNVYLHHFLRSDDDRALHDHPWVSLGVILTGEYLEHLQGGLAKRRRRFVPVFRMAKHAHRIELTHGPVWTLFITGPKVRSWGFHCPQGWRHWRIFTSGPRGETIGRGCGE